LITRVHFNVSHIALSIHSIHLSLHKLLRDAKSWHIYKLLVTLSNISIHNNKVLMFKIQV
jgi:hypothetical protein